MIALLMFINLVFSQETSKPTIAVANPAIQGLNISPNIGSKIIYLELIKIDKYKVYDEFDIAEVINSNPSFQKNCFGLSCLSQLGKNLNVDYICSGSFDKLGNKIIISLKMIDINTGTIYKTAIREFSNQENEIQRMIEITLKGMLGLEYAKETDNQLSFKNEVITSTNVSRINNSGPRIGYAMVTGRIDEFARRSEDQGGLDALPYFSMIGYQFEKQYIGTENFASIFEVIPNIVGLEQGYFLPSISLLNGFRFGKKGWEFAFGPSFGIQKTSKGFFDSENQYGKGAGHFWTEKEYNEYENAKNLNTLNPFTPPVYQYSNVLDNRGNITLSTRWVMGIGRTFKSGALNVPVNVFYASTRKGGMLGLSVGFNVTKKKESIYDTRR